MVGGRREAGLRIADSGPLAGGGRRKATQMSLFISTRKVKELQDRVDKLETAFKSLDLEWSSTYDKFRSILARIAKREERLRVANEVDSSAGSQGDSETNTGTLSPSLDPISARILARRNRLTQRNTQ